ncbi:MAG TPA: hypothetical protein VHI31_06045 [Actinomycetota bacterium]|nr:hypothetical protein [Actinomycetota bacterium]
MFLLILTAVACGPAEEPGPSPSSPGPTPSEPSPQAETVKIFLAPAGSGDCAEVVEVEREVGGRPTLRTGMEQLLAGPTDEERARGLGGWFSEATRDLLISAEREGDVARVDFKDLRDVIPNASSSCGSAGLLAQLDSTAKQFGASRTLYSINGDLDTFYSWLQLTTPEP